MLKVKSLYKDFDEVKACDNVSFEIVKGETYGLVGESGSGKSTIGNMLIGLVQPTNGEVIYNETQLWSKGKYIRPDNGKLQIVFQDPQSSLDGRMSIKKIITEPLHALPISERKGKFDNRFLGDLLRCVGMHEDHLSRSPHEFSGGQRQRIAIARAIISEPEFIILDEPTSALDVSVQAQILNLLKSLQKERNLTYLFISHDMSVIQYMCDRVGVLYHGKMVEEETTEKLFQSSKEAYTRKLLSSLPKLFEGKGNDHV
jgi:ABC-type oligopeptide transport system ATPase subunit